MRTFLLTALLAIAPAFAEEPAAKPAAAEGRPYVDAAVAFLKALTHVNRPGEAGAQAWAEAQANAAEKVSLKVAGKELSLDLAGKKSDAQLVKFQKLSTLRDGKDIKGVAIDAVEVKTEGGAHSGKGKLLMSEKDGKWLVTSFEVE